MFGDQNICVNVVKLIFEIISFFYIPLDQPLFPDV